jgi:hypothetical protein
MIASKQFQDDKQGFYENQFEKYLNTKYDLCECEVVLFETFTVCALLATPK